MTLGCDFGPKQVTRKVTFLHSGPSGWGGACTHTRMHVCTHACTHAHTYVKFPQYVKIGHRPLRSCSPKGKKWKKREKKRKKKKKEEKKREKGKMNYRVFHAKRDIKKR